MINKKVDAIIVGSGAGGATAARILTERGFNVVIFEKGPNPSSDSFLPYDELHFKIHEKMTPSEFTDPNIYVWKDQIEPVRRWWIANIVGGATRIWDANFPRYTHEDMALQTLMGDKVPKEASVVDWPWTYDEFQQYYEWVEREWGVSGKTRQSPKQEPYRSGYDFPMPPVRPHASTPLIEKIFNQAGWFPYLGAKAINSVTYSGRPGFSFSGFFAGFGDPVNDRSSAYNTMLPKAIATGKCDLRFNHCVTRIAYEKGRTKGVYFLNEPNGKEEFLEAPIVIVSIQAIESARLFLISKIPDPNRLIGHYLTYHTKGTITATFKNQSVWDGGNNTPFQPRTGIGSLEVRDLYWIEDPSTYLSKGGKFASFDPYTTSTPIEMVSRIGKWGKTLVDEINILRTQGGIGFSFTGESMPVYENRVELDPKVKDPWGLPVARTFYEHHDYDIDLSEYALNQIAMVLEKGGAQITNIIKQSKKNSGYGHNHGTLRAGIDPIASVLDDNCQAHEVKGLYVLDCSFMPTSGASNPTLTLLANAYRVCKSIPKL
jgi:choline dehydrogenase-like flavoprotein